MSDYDMTESGILTVTVPDAPDMAGELDRFAARRAGKYRIENGVIEYLKPARDQSGRSKSADDSDKPSIDEIPVALTFNFAALIVEENLLDDGLEAKAAFTIEGRLQDGRALLPVIVPATQFAGMGWITQHWGTRAILAPGTAVKDNMRAAMQVLSGDVPRKTIYQHTGWRYIGGTWQYLSGSGAIGANGLDTSIHVDTGKMPYDSPAPPSNPLPLAERVLELLKIAPSNPAVGTSLLCAIVRAVLAECHPIDFSLFLAGRSGAQKSEAAALAQGAFGRFNSRNLPAGFTDTESDLELKAHQAKDAVFVVDDFAPSTSQTEANRMYAKAERLCRAVGNQAGRGRRNSDLSARPAYHPRGMVILTGEDVPRGASLLGRLLVIDMKRGDIDLPTLSALQALLRERQLAELIAAYIQYLAPRMAELKRDFPKRIMALRDEALAAGFAGSHPRAADIYASLYAGAEVYMQFIRDCKALSELDAAAILDDIDLHLRNAIRAQGDYQRHTDEVERFKELLRACFMSGECHVADHLKQGPPQINPHTWGWRRPTDDENACLAARGALIGWLNEPKAELWLVPDATIRAVQRFTAQQNEPFLISQNTLWKRLLERGELLASEKDAKTGTQRPTVKRSTGGKSVRVLVIAAQTVTAGGE